MLRAFSTAATGMTAQQMVVDTIANNLANINTAGFKKTQIDFQDLMYVKMAQAGREVSSGVTDPTGFEVGSGVRPAATMKVYTQGEMENTGNDLNIAIEGPGFFQVRASDGSTRYTRDGSLRVDKTGNLVTSNGYTLEPTINVGTDATSVSIGQDGTVTVFGAANSQPQNKGQILLVRFVNPSGLSNEGRNLLAQTDASGAAEQDTASTIQQGFLERSNVQMVTELVNLITAQRAYETNSRAIKAGDEMLTTANRLVNG